MGDGLNSVRAAAAADSLNPGSAPATSVTGATVSAIAGALTSTELLIFTIARLLHGVRHVAVGASSPIPGAAALLTRAQSNGTTRVSVLGSRRHNAFTNGGVELFDLAAQGRIDAFFLGGGQIDGEANINLIGADGYPQSGVRWPGSFGSAYLYHLVPRVILFREEHSRRVFVPKVDFISAAGPRDDGVYRPGGPHAMLTGLCLFSFDKATRRFGLLSVHPGHTVEEVRDQTGFDFDLPAALPGAVAQGSAAPTATSPAASTVPVTPGPDAATLALMRGKILGEIGETYPNFAQTWRTALTGQGVPAAQ